MLVPELLLVQNMDPYLDPYLVDSVVYPKHCLEPFDLHEGLY